MKIEVGFKVIWSNNKWLIPMGNITKDEYFIGHTNRFKNFTYRLQPYFKIKK